MVHRSRVFAVVINAAMRPLVVAAALLAPSPAAAQTVSDCFADRVASFRIGFVSSPPAFNSWQTGILLGPPGNTTPTNGSLTVVSLGRGGEIVLEFTDNILVDGPGPDFIVFENAFFCSTVPASAVDPWSVFGEPGVVAASADGIEFHTFPYDAVALAEAVSQCSDKNLLARLVGLAGITPSFTGNYTVPDDPATFDPSAPGGVSGHGGDAFDLADVGLETARFVRITDPDVGLSLPGASEGFDLDSIVALHAVPLPSPGGPDADGDALADDVESLSYGTDPARADSDGDGTADGAEVAACRNPLDAGNAPFFLPVIDLEVVDGAATLLRWSTLGSGVLYDAARGDMAALRATGGIVDLGPLICLENDSTDLTTRGFLDTAVPQPGRAFFYVVRQTPAGSGLGYGRSWAGEPRVATSGDCG